MTLTRVVLRLGRNPDAGFPEGDDDTGYVIVAPLDREGGLDAELWRTEKAKCKVVRFTPDHQDDADGMLLHRGDRWYFHYDGEDEGPDEPVYRLGDHKLRVGEYVTIHEADGDDLTFKITEARAL
jgi:hypothetical protein